MNPLGNFATSISLSKVYIQYIEKSERKQLHKHGFLRRCYFGLNVHIHLFPDAADLYKIQLTLPLPIGLLFYHIGRDFRSLNNRRVSKEDNQHLINVASHELTALLVLCQVILRARVSRCLVFLFEPSSTSKLFCDRAAMVPARLRVSAVSPESSLLGTCNVIYTISL